MSHEPTPPRDPFLGNHYVRNPQHAEEGRSWGQALPHSHLPQLIRLHTTIFMKNNHKFTLVNFQDHSCGLLYGDSTTNWMWSFWQNMYVTDLAVDGQIIGKAYCALGAVYGGAEDDWCDELDHVHGGGDCDSPETNFTIDGTNWYSVWHYYSYGGPTVDDSHKLARGIYGERIIQPNWRSRDNVEEVTKRIGMSGRPREKVPHGSAEFLEIMEVYDRLTELVSAVAAKEPPKQA